MGRFGRERVKGFLRTSGTRIVNGDGEEIVLQGYGCGNWTNPEGFMVGAPPIDLAGGIFSPKYIPPRRLDRRRTFDQTVRELCGASYADGFWRTWQENHLAEADIRAMAGLGLNSVRLPLNWEALLEEEPGLVWKEDGFRMLDQVLDWCEAYRIYAILDLHAAPGGQSATACDGGYDNAPHLFVDDESRDRALAIWERIAERYAERWIVGGYDLLNEPVSLPNHQAFVPELARFYDDAIAVIRRHDKRHMLTLEGPKFSRSNEIFDRAYDPECRNWLIHVHIYESSPEKQELAWYILKGRELDVPVWIGEGGTDAISNAVLFGAAADYGIGFCLWCWKTAVETPFGHHAAGYRLPKDWEAVSGYAAGGPKPGYARSRAIFDELLENLKFANCMFDADHIRISRRSPDLSLPAVGYDNRLGDGSSMCGTWEHGNLLGYRLSDRTKLVLAPGVEEPRPGFGMYPDPNIRRPLDPLQSLVIELSAGESAAYTVRDCQRAVPVALEMKGTPGTVVEVDAGGGRSARIVPDPQAFGWKDALTLDPCEESTVVVRILAGTAWLRTIHFQA